MYICKLPNLEWINLGMIRRLEVDGNSPEPVARITWNNGDRQTYSGSDAIAIIQDWTEIQTVVDRRHLRLFEADDHA